MAIAYDKGRVPKTHWRDDARQQRETEREELRRFVEQYIAAYPIDYSVMRERGITEPRILRLERRAKAEKIFFKDKKG